MKPLQRYPVPRAKSATAIARKASTQPGHLGHFGIVTERQKLAFGVGRSASAQAAGIAAGKRVVSTPFRPVIAP